MLPHLADRPLTMIRMPDGIRGAALLPEALGAGDARLSSRPITVFSGTQGREPRVSALQQPADAALARADPGRSNSTSGIRARSPARRDRRRAPTTRRRSRRWRIGAQLSRLRACSTSIRTSIPARKRRAPSPSSTRSPSRKARKSRSGCASCCTSMSLEADRQDLGQDRPARLRADQAHDRLRRRAPRLRARGPAPACASIPRTSRWSGACPSEPARSSWITT